MKSSLFQSTIVNCVPGRATWLAGAICATVTFGLAGVANADRVITKNGRVLEGKVEEKDATTWRLKLSVADIDIPKDMVKEILIEGDMSGYVPKNDKEKELIAKGMVRYRDQWMPRAQYEQELARDLAKRKKALEEEAKHLQFADGWKFETQHFQVQGNCPKPQLEELASLLEDYYKFITTQIGVKASPALQRKKMTLNIFRDEADYLKAGDAPAGTGGYFSNRQESLNLYFDFEDYGYTRHVVLHEGTHLLTYLSNPKFEPPSWINEGMAEYFGSSKVTGEKSSRKIEPGQIIDSRLLTLQEMEKERYIPIDTWLAYSDSYNNVEKAKQSTYEHYSYWWAFCHFLCTHKVYGKKFFQYFRDLYNLQGFEKKTGYGGLDTGGVAFEVDPKEYTLKLYQYLGLKDGKKLDEEFRAWIRVQEPVGPRGYFYVGRDLSQYRKYDRAIEKLNQAIEKGYDTAEAFKFRADCWEAKNQRDKQIADLRKAVERNPIDARMRFNLAQALQFGSRDEAILQLKIAIELDPNETLYPFQLKLLDEGKKD